MENHIAMLSMEIKYPRRKHHFDGIEKYSILQFFIRDFDVIFCLRRVLGLDLCMPTPIPIPIYYGYLAMWIPLVDDMPMLKAIYLHCNSSHVPALTHSLNRGCSAQHSQFIKT